MHTISRRQLLASSGAATLGAVASSKLSISSALAFAPGATVLRITSRTIEVKGKPAKVFGLLQPNGTSGLVIPAGRFHVRLENRADAPTLIHWHGLLPPYGQDGVPDLPQPLLPAGQSYDYDFPLTTPGTHWMHAHTLQEQQLLAAPLIVVDPAEAKADEQPIVVLFHDFSFTPPEELLAKLTGSPAAHNMPGHSMPEAPKSPPEHGKGHGESGMDVNDIEYDAYLANDRTLEDPEVFQVERGGRIRLRLINGATATAFWIDLGDLDGDVIAVDGNPVEHVPGRRFPLGMGQRIDIRLHLPRTEGAWPILALREGAVERTGFVLATKGGAVRRVGANSERTASALDLNLETSLLARRSLPRKAPDRRETVVLGGDMAAYRWTLDGQTYGKHRPLKARAGERVEMTMRNDSMMGHPMHLHGHHFQVVAIDGRPWSGALRDTVWVPQKRAVTIAFDAGNPGTWAFHCHHLYHMATGIMTTLAYVD